MTKIKCWIKAQTLLTTLYLCLQANPLYAVKPLAFKKDWVNNTHWLPYGLVLITLCVTLLFLGKKSKHLVKMNPGCRIIEKITIHHKTKLYVIDYQGQHFLVADNQNSLAIHPVHKASSHHEE